MERSKKAEDNGLDIPRLSNPYPRDSGVGGNADDLRLLLYNFFYFSKKVVFINGLFYERFGTRDFS